MPAQAPMKDHKFDYSRYVRQFEKTSLCKFFAQGLCIKGDRCGFAHGEKQLQEPPDLRKTSICRRWSANLNGCRLSSEECPFAHGEHELRVAQGVCRRGSGKQPQPPPSPPAPSAGPEKDSEEEVDTVKWSSGYVTPTSAGRSSTVGSSGGSPAGALSPSSPMHLSIAAQFSAAGDAFGESHAAPTGDPWLADAVGAVTQILDHPGLDSAWTSALAMRLQLPAERSEAVRLVLQAHGWAGGQFASPPDRCALLRDLKAKMEDISAPQRPDNSNSNNTGPKADAFQSNVVGFPVVPAADAWKQVTLQVHFFAPCVPSQVQPVLVGCGVCGRACLPAHYYCGHCGSALVGGAAQVLLCRASQVRTSRATFEDRLEEEAALLRAMPDHYED